MKGGTASPLYSCNQLMRVGAQLHLTRASDGHCYAQIAETQNNTYYLQVLANKRRGCSVV
jgi:hypothetical protein